MNRPNCLRVTASCAFFALMVIAFLKVADLGSAPGDIYIPGNDIVTADPAWDRYLTAQKRWQQEVAELNIRKRPDLREACEAELELHWALLDLRAAKVRYLIKNDPARIVRDKGLAHFISIAGFWTADDSAAIREQNPGFIRLEGQVTRIRDLAMGHPGYAESREYFESNLWRDPEYREILTTFTRECDEVERMLKEAVGP